MPLIATLTATLPRLLQLVVHRPRRLRDFTLDGKRVEHCKLAERFTVDAGSERTQMLTAFDAAFGVTTDVLVPGRSVYAHINRQLTTTPVWKISTFIDTDTKERKRALHMEDIKEHKQAARALFGEKTSGIIILINGKEPGDGTTPLHNYLVKPGDVVDIVYKGDRIIKYK